MPDIYIAEDEDLARLGLIRMCDSMRGWQVVGSANNGLTALKQCLKAPPDLLITDIQMPVLDGIELVRTLRPELPKLHVIFVTAYDQYAIEAFEVHAVDYLLKPLDQDKLSTNLNQIAKRLNDDRTLATLGRLNLSLDQLIKHHDTQSHIKQFVVKSVGKIEVVPIDQVLAIKSCGNYVELICPTGSVLHRQTLKSIVHGLDPQHFQQIHRSILVAKKHIKSLNCEAKMHSITLSNQMTFPVSASHVASVKADLKQ